MPALAVRGAALIGCAAGFVNLPRIKGSHNAIASGMQAAEAAAALEAGRSHDRLAAYADGWRASPIGRDLHPVRNVKPLWSRLGTLGGVVLGGLDMWTNALANVSMFGTLKHGQADHEAMRPLAAVTPVTYPKPDGTVSFDKTSSVYLSGTTHADNQPPHLVLADPTLPVARNLPLYGAPSRLYCPVDVYEIAYADEAAKTDPRFVISAQTACTAKPATSRIRRRTSPGHRQKAEEGRSTRGYEPDASRVVRRRST